MPVIVVVYEAPTNTAYWLYVQAHLEKRSGFDPIHGTRTVTLRIPKSNRVGEGAIEQFAQYKDAILAQQKGLVHHE